MSSGVSGVPDTTELRRRVRFAAERAKRRAVTRAEVRLDGNTELLPLLDLVDKLQAENQRLRSTIEAALALPIEAAECWEATWHLGYTQAALRFREALGCTYDDAGNSINPKPKRSGPMARTLSWIPVSQRLPPKGQLVEVKTPGGHERWLIYDSGLWWLPDRSMYVYFTPTGWRL